MNEFLSGLSSFLQLSIQMGTTLLFGTLGGILCEKVGHLNLGIEGMMLMGAVFGHYIGLSTGSPLFAILGAGIAGLVGALIYAFITVSLKGNQTVTGLVLTIFGSGIANFIGKILVKNQKSGLLPDRLPVAVADCFKPFKIPVLSDIPVIGKALFHQSIFIPISIICAVLLYVYLKKTKFGLDLRVVGENPAAADASGINISLYKYVHILAGGFLCGLGGAYLSLSFLSTWKEGMTSGLGWIAVALIIFSTWNPLKAIFGAYFFGILRCLPFKIQNASLFGIPISIPSQFLTMLPYVMTIVALVFITLRKKKENSPPAWLGNPYFREDR